MAHWNDEQDARRVKLARNLPADKYKDLVDKFEESGDIIYWNAIVEKIMKDGKKDDAQ
jgi:hypothetical protein